jgi:hypothetical protein
VRLGQTGSQGQGELSFFEKRTKQLLSIDYVPQGANERPARIKVFLLLFLQKKKSFLSR